MTAKRVTLLLCLLGGVPTLLHGSTTPLIEGGGKTEWRYRDDGAEPPACWNATQFDGSAWKRGPAPLGYGEREIATTLSFGPHAEAKYMAAYFRREFDLRAAPPGAQQLVVEMRIDDGAVVYLNGREVVRQNVAPGDPSAKTRAVVRVDGDEEGLYCRYVIPASALQTGRNVLAAEIHQCDGRSSDLFFDLRLTLTDDPLPSRLSGAAREVTLTYRQKHYVPPAMRIPDGFIDGGRHMTLAADGTPTSHREILLVDRSRDPQLRRQLEYARWLRRGNLPSTEAVVLLAQYVDVQYSPDDGRDYALPACDLLLHPHAGKEVVIGDVTHAGVCRHRALVFKVLADEAGLRVALVRGNLGRGGDHTWNEWIGPDGAKRIVDLMNPTPGYRFPRTTEPAAAAYLTVDEKPYYSSDNVTRN